MIVDTKSLQLFKKRTAKGFPVSLLHGLQVVNKLIQVWMRTGQGSVKFRVPSFHMVVGSGAIVTMLVPHRCLEHGKHLSSVAVQPGVAAPKHSPRKNTLECFGASPKTLPWPAPKHSPQPQNTPLQPQNTPPISING